MPIPLEPSSASLHRVIALADGVFAIALTLIVLEIRIPSQEAVHTEGELARAVAALAPRFLTYALSFLTLTLFWFGQQAQLTLLARSDRRLATLHLVFLAFVALLPFSTDLLADFISFRTAVILFWINLVALGAALFLAWSYAVPNDMVAEDVEQTTVQRVRGRIARAQVLWAVGAALGLVSPFLGVAFWLAVQIIYALAPRTRWLRAATG